MSERKPLGLNANQKQLREQRALALARLANPTSPPTTPAAAPPPAPKRERFDSPVRDHKGARPVPAAASPRPNGPGWLQPSTPRAAGSSTSGVRRVTVSEVANGTRLNKRMAELGLCSRREGDAWIEQGWVTVNGVVATMGQLVQPTDRIEVTEQARGEQQQQVTILLHKPMGFVSGQAEDGHQPAVALINPRTRWQHCTSRTRFNFSQLQGLAPAGRLDIDSVGLLVLTQDGRVARQLIGEDADMEKEYLVRVVFTPSDGTEVSTGVQNAFPADRLALLRHGLSLDGEALKPAQVEWQNPEQLRFVLTQGKKRQIRRMCEQVGLKVVGLKRIRMGRITLGNLPAGQWRYLLPTERF